MLIYRVEHEANGHGPYIIPYALYEDDEEYGDYIRTLSDDISSAHADVTHPMPGAIWRRDGHICGFESMSALREWFEGWEADLAEFDYVIRTFEVPDEAVWAPRSGGYGQVTFDKSQAKCLTTEMI